VKKDIAIKSCSEDINILFNSFLSASHRWRQMMIIAFQSWLLFYYLITPYIRMLSS